VAYGKRAGVLWVHGGCLRHEHSASLTIFEREAYLKRHVQLIAAVVMRRTPEKEEVPMLRFVLALLISFALICTTGCETFKGFGRDMQKGGRDIEDAASK